MKTYHVIPRWELEQDDMAFDSEEEAIQCANVMFSGAEMVVLKAVAVVRRPTAPPIVDRIDANWRANHDS